MSFAWKTGERVREGGTLNHIMGYNWHAVIMSITQDSAGRVVGRNDASSPDWEAIRHQCLSADSEGLAERWKPILA